MLRRFLVLTLALGSMVSGASARRAFDIIVTPTVSSTSGYTKYVLDEDGYLTQTVYGHVKSELRFPTGTTYAGLKVGIAAKPESRWDWSVNLSYGGNVSDPSTIMGDWDWIRWPSRFNGLWSYTWSDAKMWSRDWSLEARASIEKRKHFSYGLLAGIQVQRFKQDLFNLDGWQTDPSTGGTDTATASLTGYVGYYSVTWKIPYAGVYFDWKPIRAAHSNFMVAFSPVWVTDKDIHVLRNRDALGSGNGKGLIASWSGEYLFGAPQLRHHPVIGLEIAWRSFAVKGDQDIYWYGDDPITAENDTGTSSKGISHQMTSEQLKIEMHVGMQF